MKKALFIFRRDLRIQDNTGLHFALTHAMRVVPCFIFTPDQIERSTYRSDRCLQFMIESLEDLGQALKAKGGKLYLFYGKPEKVVEECIQRLQVDVVVLNRDYTPYSLQRDKKIEAVCVKRGAAFFSFEDALLHAPEETLKKNDTPYTVFTPFYRNAHTIPVRPVVQCRAWPLEKKTIAFAKGEQIYQELLPERFAQAKGGRTEGLKILRNLKKWKEYEQERDFPAGDATTHLSAHLKFTTCSPREVYHAITKSLGKESALIRSLYWRDFFTSIAFYFPHVLGAPFHEKFAKLTWSYSKAHFRLWCEGKTGFPIVDAGMRQLQKTGYMHNRVRMIVASFLIKDMHIDWLWGEKYFAQTLIDYDPAVNNGNWQWVASTGCDAQPYFRIFNPWLQQKKFDPQCVYIKRWVDELREVPSAQIHQWYREDHRPHDIDYPAPLLEHDKEVKITLRKYARVVS